MAIPSPANGEEFTRQLTRVVNPDGSNIGQTTPNGDSLIDDTVNAWQVTKVTLDAGEDLANDVQKVEQRFSLLKCAADTQVKSGAGFLHTLTFSCNDAAPTAGSIIVYDNTAESGTELFNHTFTTTPFVPFSVVLDGTFSTGLYVGFTTTADVNVTVSYR